MTTGDPVGFRTKGEGDWKVLDRAGTSKTSELKVSAMKIVGGPGGEGTECGGPRRESSSGRGDRRGEFVG